MLQRETLTSENIYLIYNAMGIYILVGQQANPQLIQELYKVGEFASINMLLTEEEMFAEVE